MTTKFGGYWKHYSLDSDPAEIAREISYPSKDWTISNSDVLCYLLHIGMEISVYYIKSPEEKDIPAMEIIYKKKCLFSVDYDDPELREIGLAQSNALGIAYELNLPSYIIEKIQERRARTSNKYKK